MSPSSPARRPAAAANNQGGFVLLEILMALVIFATLVLAYAKATDNALEAAAEANNDRMLRLLSSRKLAEVRAKPAAFIDSAEGDFNDEVDPGAENPFSDFHWKVEAQEVVAAGYAADQGTVFLFDRDQAGGAPDAPTGGKAPDPVKLVRLTLTVSRVPEGSDESDSMRVVTFVPAPPADAAKGGAR